ncbi:MULTISPECIES: hypothetical protein [Streptomyces]|nr:hypothetical protein [Streptomyces sp. M54]
MGWTHWAAPGGGPDGPAWLSTTFAIVVGIVAVVMGIALIRRRRR